MQSLNKKLITTCLLWLIAFPITSNEIGGLEEYLVLSTFYGESVCEISKNSKQNTLYLKDKTGKDIFRYIQKFQTISDGFIVDGTVETEENPFKGLIAKFDDRGIFLHTLKIEPKIDGYTIEKFSYTGNYAFLDMIPGIAIVNFNNPKKFKIITKEAIIDLQPLRSDKAIIYQTEDLKIKKYDIDTATTKTLLDVAVPLLFGDVSYDNSKVLCTDEKRILILDLAKNKLEVVKEYKPGIFTFRRKTPAFPKYSRPIIVTGKFSWREDSKGFIFCRFSWRSNILWLGLDSSYKPPDLYYYDLETKKETLLRKKTGKRGISLKKRKY